MGLRQANRIQARRQDKDVESRSIGRLATSMGGIPWGHHIFWQEDYRSRRGEGMRGGK